MQIRNERLAAHLLDIYTWSRVSVSATSLGADDQAIALLDFFHDNIGTSVIHARQTQQGLTEQTTVCRQQKTGV